MYKIEKAIPVPSKSGERTKKLKALISKMKLGDSFLVPDKEVSKVRSSFVSLRVKYVSRKVSGSYTRFWIAHEKKQLTPRG